jgi:acetyl esterase/lipase
LQGEHDDFVKAEAVRVMAEKLRAARMPTVYVGFPQTEHAFDLFLPHYSPATQAALYGLDRFLGLIALKTGTIRWSVLSHTLTGLVRVLG